MQSNSRFSGKNISLIAVMFCIMLIFVVSGVVGLVKNEDMAPAYYASSKNKILDKGREGAVYIVRLHQGNIAVFFADNPEVPIRNTDISEDTLRNFDREQLTDGIVVYGDTELAMILEDFGS